MQSALRSATIDEDEVVHFIEICYCLEGGLYPLAMEIPVLNKLIEWLEGQISNRKINVLKPLDQLLNQI
jgi:hypothetical protein